MSTEGAATTGVPAGGASSYPIVDTGQSLFSDDQAEIAEARRLNERLVERALAEVQDLAA